MHEDGVGRPFVGRAGDEFNHKYLQLGGLDRNRVMVANAVRCFAVNGGENPSKEQARACAGHHLPALLSSLPNLKYIVPMGGVAWSLVDGQTRDIDVQHGLHIEGTLLGGTKEWIIHPTIHPAAGLHKPDEIARIRKDFKNLKELLDGGWVTPEDEYPNPKYELYKLGRYEDPGEFARRVGYLAMDTEQDKTGPNGEWCLTISFGAGSGGMMRCVGEAREIEYLAGWLWEYCKAGGKVFMHYAMHDQLHLQRFPTPVIIPWENVIDTMMLAYHRSLPQGLKALGYRLCGVDMKDYDDVVRPYAEAKMFRWLGNAGLSIAGVDGWKALLWKMVKDTATPAAYKTKASQLNQNSDWVCRLMEYGVAPKRAEEVQTMLMEWMPHLRFHDKGTVWPYKEIGGIFRDKEKGFDVRPFDRWGKICERRPEILEAAEQLVGEMPSTGISEVPPDEALEYACRDADVTLRVGLKLLEQKEIEQV